MWDDVLQNPDDYKSYLKLFNKKDYNYTDTKYLETKYFFKQESYYYSSFVFVSEDYNYELCFSDDHTHLCFNKNKNKRI